MRGYRTYDKPPAPGELRNRITIGETRLTTNENGFEDIENVILCRVWAKAEDAGEEDTNAADAHLVGAGVHFTIRYRSDIKPGMWVEFRGLRYRITNLTNFGFNRSWLGLCTITERLE